LQSDTRHDRVVGEAVAATEEMYVAVVGIKGSTITAAPVRPRREHSAQSGWSRSQPSRVFCQW